MRGELAPSTRCEDLFKQPTRSEKFIFLLKKSFMGSVEQMFHARVFHIRYGGCETIFVETEEKITKIQILFEDLTSLFIHLEGYLIKCSNPS